MEKIIKARAKLEYLHEYEKTMQEIAKKHVVLELKYDLLASEEDGVTVYQDTKYSYFWHIDWLEKIRRNIKRDYLCLR